MKILDTILQIEDNSKAQVAEAQKKAREIREAAEKENADRLSAARAESAAALAASVNEAKKEWEEKYRATLHSQDALQSDFIQSKSSEIESAADKIAAIIKNPQYKNIDD